jgi:exosortase
MNSTTPMETGILTEPRTKTRLWTKWTLPLVGLAAGWLLVFNALRADWATNAQYYYGWFVPILALGLFRLRWGLRPAPMSAWNPHFSTVGAIALLVLLLPIRLIEEANPEWRLIQWAHALQMIVLTFCLLNYAGGWSWVRHFAFPVCFLLVAVPWPVPLEQNFVQSLMRVIAGITVELVGLFGIPAVQHGNIIQINAGLVGIDEACSGVRSLQTALFICLFLGELYRFAWSRRIVLIFLGFLVALLANLGRTFYLVWSAFHHGMDRMHAVHDLAGQLVMVFTLIGIWLVSQGLRRRASKSLPSRSPDPLPSIQAVHAVPAWCAISVLVWVVMAELATEGWYRAHEASAVPNRKWLVSWPQSPMRAQTSKIDDSVTAMLRYNEGQEATWQDNLGNNWQAFFFRWAPGRNSAQLASAHTPDICLKGVGCRLTSDLGVHFLEVKGLKLPFKQYIFDRGGAPLHVFYCRWEDEINHVDTSYDDGGKLSRIRAVLAGRRHLGQQVLEAIVSGPATADEGLATFESQLPQLIRISNHS